jgi:periplasmic protein TonB
VKIFPFPEMTNEVLRKMKSDEKNGNDWYTAVFFAVVLNAVIFSLMPGLLSSKSDLKDAVLPIHPINVIRIKHPERPPEKKPKQKPEPEKKEPQKALNQAVAKKPPVARLKLPFEINPRLPQMPGVNPSLFMEKYAVHGVDVYEMGEIDKPISTVYQVPPVYPMRAKRLGIEGWVRVNILVSAEGDVEDVEILESEPKGVFENSVIQNVRSWRYSPGTVDGKPVRTRGTVTIRFNLENE